MFEIYMHSMCTSHELILQAKRRHMKKTEHTGCAHGSCSHHHHHHDGEQKLVRRFAAEIITGLLFGAALILFHYVHPWAWWIEFTVYLLMLLPVGWPVVVKALQSWREGDVFNEFTLMLLASVGAFAIGEYPEGVAVLLFYSIGEKLEDVVSGDVRAQIKGLIGKMPRYAWIETDGKLLQMEPAQVTPGETEVVKPGETVVLDGELLSDEADMDVSAMTGESVPRTYRRGEEVPSGAIPVDREIRLRVKRPYSDSAMMRMMRMIEESSANRAPSETVLHRITRWYTPVVMGGAVLLFVIPWLVGLTSGGFDFVWQDWLRRSLVFLVCSCPCALVVSIPLTYFASIGVASRQGILFKGHRQLDDMRRFRVMLLDKTGTVTTGRFRVSGIRRCGAMTGDEVLALAAAVDSQSAHPLAKAIEAECKSRGLQLAAVDNVRTVNHGMEATMSGRKVLVGSALLMEKSGVETRGVDDVAATAVYVSADGQLVGVISLEDTVKPGSPEAVAELHALGVHRVGILSGDRNAAVSKTAGEVGADFFKAQLLPVQKVQIIADYRREGVFTAFAGDGVNDGPALAAAGVGIAMGTYGSDIAIESADVVIAGDDLRKIPLGIKISRKVRSLLIENVGFAFGVKIVVMALGALGIATLWAAVFADTGVTLITVIWTLCRLRIWKLRKRETDGKQTATGRD